MVWLKCHEMLIKLCWCGVGCGFTCMHIVAYWCDAVWLSLVVLVGRTSLPDVGVVLSCFYFLSSIFHSTIMCEVDKQSLSDIVKLVIRWITD